MWTVPSLSLMLPLLPHFRRKDGPGSELEEACLDVAQLPAERATRLGMLAKLGIVSRSQSGCTP